MTASTAPSAIQQKRLADAIASGRFSVAALHATYVAAAASGEPLDVVLGRALDHADQGASMVNWQNHKAWQPPTADAPPPTWHRTPPNVDDDGDLAIDRGIAAMTTDGRARFLAQNMSEAEIDALAEAILAAPEGRRQADVVGYVTRAARTRATPTTTTGVQPMPMTDEQRRAAIGALLLPGHEALVAQCQADPTCTPSQAALKVAAADRARRDAAVASPTESASGSVDAVASKGRAEFEASAELQGEFASADHYVNYQQGVASGRIRRAGGSGTVGSRVARSMLGPKA